MRNRTAITTWRRGGFEQKPCGLVMLLIGAVAMAFCAMPATVHAQLLVGVGDDIAEYDASTGTSINSTFISDSSSAAVSITQSGSDLFVAYNNGTIEEYTTSGAVVNASLITGLNFSSGGGLAVSGSNLFITQGLAGVVEYGTDGSGGSTPTFNSNVNDGIGIAASGSTLFIANHVDGYADGTVGSFDASGTTNNASLVTDVGDVTPDSVAVSGTTLYIASDPTTGNVLGNGGGTVTSYSTSGTVNGGFTTITGVYGPVGIAVSGSDLFVASYGGTVAEYGTDGSSINASFVTSASSDSALWVLEAVPEPSAYAAIFGVLALGAAIGREMRRRREEA